VSIRTLYFIGQCLSLDEHLTFRDEIIVQFTDENYNWNQFIWTCSNHLVLQVIYLKFLKHDLLSYVPDVLAQHLEEIYMLNRTRNGQILLQVKEITATLDKSGISPIFMKGTGNLIDGIYDDIGERIIGDIDFLVPEKDLLSAINLFKKEGYINSFPAYKPYNQKQHHHYPQLWKEDVAADIEIHWLPVSIKNATGFGAEFVQKNKKAVIDLPGSYVPCDKHKIIQNFVHSQLTNSGNRLGVVSLRDIYDVYCFSKRTDLIAVLPLIHYRREAEAYFTIAQKLLGLPISVMVSLSTTFFCWKHDMNLKSRLFFSLYRLPWVLSRILFHGYPHQIKEAFIFKGARQSLLRRLGNRQWYIQHFRLIRKNIAG